MLSERIEQRVLGALHLVDRVTGTPLTRPMQIGSDKLRLVRNLRGLYVITHADGLEAHAEAFQAAPSSPEPGANAYSLEVHDPLMRFLPRLVTLHLPRDPDPDKAGRADSLFTPRDVLMYPASTAGLSPNWSTVRATVTQGPDPQTTTPVRGSLIRIIDIAEERVLSSGLSDERGEALIIVPGVPVTKFAEEDPEDDAPPGGGPPGGGPPGAGHGHGHDHDQPPVLVNTLAVRLELSLADSAPWPANPDLLEQNHDVNRRVSLDLELTTGRMERVAINVT